MSPFQCIVCEFRAKSALRWVHSSSDQSGKSKCKKFRLNGCVEFMYCTQCNHIELMPYKLDH